MALFDEAIFDSLIFDTGPVIKRPRPTDYDGYRVRTYSPARPGGRNPSQR